MRKACTLLSGLVLTLLSAAGNAEACNCEAKPDLRAALEKSTIIFIGRVIRTTKNPPLRPNLAEVELTVLQKYKGGEEMQSDKVLIYTQPESADCGFKFIPNLDYVVFAYGYPASYRTDICTRTMLYDDPAAKLDVEKLNRLSAPKKDPAAAPAAGAPPATSAPKL